MHTFTDHEVASADEPTTPSRRPWAEQPTEVARLLSCLHVRSSTASLHSSNMDQ